MNKKKLLIFHPALAPYRIDLFNSLNELFDLHVVFLYDNIRAFKYNQDFLLSQCTFDISFLLKGISHKGRVFRFGMYKKIKSINPDIILGEDYSFTTQFLILLKRLGLINQKIGTAVDDSLDICLNIQSRIRYLARKISINYLEYTVVMSKEVSEYYQVYHNLKEEKIIISPILQSSKRLREKSNEIEFSAQKHIEKHHLDNKKILLFVGRLVSEKALPLLLNNIYSVLQEDNSLVLVIVGEGDEKELLEKIIDQKNLHDNVILAGRYDNEDLYGWYLCASGFVLPSLSETFGAVVNEALIFGLPVLCSKYAGASCLINHENGLIFDPSDKVNTIKSLKLFLSTINTLRSVELGNKPSLINDHASDFKKEWSKLIN